METLLVHQKATSSLIDSWETSTVTVLYPSKICEHITNCEMLPLGSFGKVG